MTLNPAQDWAAHSFKMARAKWGAIPLSSSEAQNWSRAADWRSHRCLWAEIYRFIIIITQELTLSKERHAWTHCMQIPRGTVCTSPVQIHTRTAQFSLITNHSFIYRHPETFNSRCLRLVPLFYNQKRSPTHLGIQPLSPSLPPAGSVSYFPSLSSAGSTTVWT